MVITILAWGITAGTALLATGGGTAATAHVGVEVLNRRMGYKKGEGPLTKKACDGLGLIVHEKSPSEAGQCIAQLNSTKKFAGLYFSLTESEGQTLDEMVQPVKILIEVRGKLVKDLVQHAMRGDMASVQQTQAELQKLDDSLDVSARPIVRMLDAVPSSRRRHIPGA